MLTRKSKINEVDEIFNLRSLGENAKVRVINCQGCMPCMLHVACLGGQGFLTLSGYRRDEVLGRCSYDLPTGCRERTHHAKRQKRARLSNHLLPFNMLKQCPNFPNPTSGRFS